MPALIANARFACELVFERLSRADRGRVPEPMVMDDDDSVAAFHTAHPVLQLPVYRANALAMSRLLPEGGTVLDLGSGSGQLLAHLATARPDVRIVGTDLAETMIATGRSMLQESGLADRVTLEEADMTDLPEAVIPERVDLVSTVWALHHLPTEEHLHAAARQLARVRERHGCAVWVFDFARLKRDRTFEVLLDIAPDAPERLREDGIASERAAWSGPELRRALDAAGVADAEGGVDRVVGHLQCYRAPAASGAPSGHDAHWTAGPVPRESRALLRRIRVGMPFMPS
jgi:SAM-dependent methyltransferase